jgi:hypothetical protein
MRIWNEASETLHRVWMLCWDPTNSMERGGKWSSTHSSLSNSNVSAVLQEVALVLCRGSLAVERAETGDNGCDDGVGRLVPASGNHKWGHGEPVGARGHLVEDLWVMALEATIVHVEVLAFKLSNCGDSGSQVGGYGGSS